MAATPEGTRRKGRMLFGALPLAHSTQPLAGSRSGAIQKASSTRLSGQARSFSTWETKVPEEGFVNTAIGAGALFSNTDGSRTRPLGPSRSLTTWVASITTHWDSALFSNASGLYNNALGRGALESNVDGSQNNACGDQALQNNVSGNFTAMGDGALGFCTGDSNVAVGNDAGDGITTGSNIIAIGAGVLGVSTPFGQVDNSCYIGNIQGAVVDATTAASVCRRQWKVRHDAPRC